jgi:hypothetical protein
MNKTVDQDAEEEGTVDPRGVDGRRPVAEHDADDRNNERGRETRQCAISKIILAQSRQREHAVAHGEGNCDRGRYQAAKNIIACLRCRLHGDFRLLATTMLPGLEGGTCIGSSRRIHAGSTVETLRPPEVSD